MEFNETITVGELIKRLKHFPSDAVVAFMEERRNFPLSSDTGFYFLNEKIDIDGYIEELGIKSPSSLLLIDID
jgi:hypothetical protein